MILSEVIAVCGVFSTRLSNINLPFKRKSPGICQAREQKKSREGEEAPRVTIIIENLIFLNKHFSQETKT